MNGTSTDITDKIIVIAAKYHKPEYQGIEYRLFRAEGGFGCRPETIGQAVFGRYLIDGEEARIEGPMVERLATPEEVALVKH